MVPRQHRNTLLITAFSIAIMFGELAWIIYGKAHSFAQVERDAYSRLPKLPKKTAANTPPPDTTILKRIALMGAPEKLKDPAQDPALLPKTTLQLKLLGAFTSSSEQRNSALISQNQQAAKLINIGDAIAPGVTLSKVHRNAVIINRNGKFETLAFADEIANKAIKAAPVAPPPRAAQAPIQRPAPPLPEAITEKAASEMNNSIRAQLKKRADELRRLRTVKAPAK